MNNLTKDLLAAGRTSNLPTVWSNVLLGALVSYFSKGIPVQIDQWIPLLTALFTGTCLYTAGCFYNDYYDHDWDAKHKPERAIPSGRLSPPLLYFLIHLLLISSMAGALSIGISALFTTVFISAAILVYTRIHKKTVLGVLPMGLCRAGLYILGFASVHDATVSDIASVGYIIEIILLGKLTPVFIPALGLASYIAGLTLIARSEATNALPKWAKWFGYTLLAIPFFTHLESPLYGIILATLLVFLHLTLKEKGVGSFVSNALSGICLVDLMLALAITEAKLLYGMVFLTLYFLARLLQRIAPAT